MVRQVTNSKKMSKMEREFEKHCQVCFICCEINKKNIQLIDSYLMSRDKLVHDYLGQEKFNRTQLCSFCKDIQPGCKTCTGKTFNSNFTLKWNRSQTDLLKNCWKVTNNPLSKQIMRVNLHVKARCGWEFIHDIQQKRSPLNIFYTAVRKKPRW